MNHHTPHPGTTGHVALLGDSIFDNAAYTSGAPDVVTHLRRLLPPGWQATLCAVDGATTTDLDAQLARVPDAATDVVISVGGNDALQSMDLLTRRVASVTQALQAFAEPIGVFERRYRSAVEKVLKLERRTCVCTIYNGALEPDLAVAAVTGVRLFNDVILRTALELGLRAIELRSVCTEPADYANPIEPSDQGGLKIARAILGVLV